MDTDIAQAADTTATTVQAQVADQDITPGIRTKPPQQPQAQAQAQAATDDSPEPNAKKGSRAAEEYEREIKELRAEAAKHRTEKQAALAKVQEYEKAKLTEQERLQLERDEYKQRVEELSARERKLVLEHAFERLASAAGAVDPDLLITRLEASHIEYDEATGRPTEASLKAAIDDLKDRYPKQFQSSAPSSDQRPASGAPVNAPRSQAASKWFNQSDVENWDFYSKNRAEVDLALREGRIRLGQ